METSSGKASTSGPQENPIKLGTAVDKNDGRKFCVAGEVGRIDNPREIEDDWNNAENANP